MSYQSFVAVRAEIARFGGILAGMNRMSRVIDKLAAKTEDTQEVWLRLVSAATFGLIGVLWIIGGLIRGPFHLKDWVHILQLWTGVLLLPLQIFLLIVNIQVLRKVRRRESGASLAD